MRNLWVAMIALAALTACAEEAERFATGAPTLGEFRLGHNIAIADEVIKGPLSRDFTETQLEASVQNAVAEMDFTSAIFESTAYGAQGWFYEMVQAAIDGENEFISFFAPWYWDPEYVQQFADHDERVLFRRNMPEEDVALMLRFNLSLEQMKWRKWCIRNKCSNKVRQFRQEYPSDVEEAFLTSGMPAFDPDKVHALKGAVRDPLVRGEIIYVREANPEIVPTATGFLKIWDQPWEGHDYVIGADCAEGKVRDKASSAKGSHNYLSERPDYTAAVVVELETGKHVATWHGYLNTTDFTGALAALGIYYNEALLIVEANHPGPAVIENLQRLYQYPNLYRSRVWGKVDITEGIDIGWRTTITTRPILISKVEHALGEGYLDTRDERLVRELRTMQIDDSGNPRAKGKDKDDTVFAYALAMQGRSEMLGGTVVKGPEIEAKPDDWVWQRMEQKYGSASAGGGRPVFRSDFLGRHLPDLEEPLHLG